jgi:hypothetical protein
MLEQNSLKDEVTLEKVDEKRMGMDMFSTMKS